MATIAIISALLATIGSLTSLIRLTIQNHTMLQPQSISKLAAAEEHLLRQFRVGLFVCSSLFSVSVYGFIVPGLGNGLPLAICWTITYLSILCAALLPARGNSFRWHVIAGKLMALSMLILAYLFFAYLNGKGQLIELVLAAAMTLLIIVTYTDKKRFVFYEVAYLGFSHITIIVACLTLAIAY